MRPDEGDAAYLWDMLQAAELASEFVLGVSYQEYLADRRTQAAVERQIEIIGEAARRISRDFQDSHAEIPWKKIVAQRHVLAHEYGEIRQDRIWLVATAYVPDLISQLRPLLPPLPPQA